MTEFLPRLRSANPSAAFVLGRSRNFQVRRAPCVLGWLGFRSPIRDTTYDTEHSLRAYAVAGSPTLEPMSDSGDTAVVHEGEAVSPQGPGDEVLPQLDEETRERRRAALANVRTFGDPVL